MSEIKDRKKKFRMYVDEVGNSDLRASENPNHRYLSLTGVVMDLDYVDQHVFPQLESLKKKYFGSHADDPIVLHRKELVNKKHPFTALRDVSTAEQFDKEFLTFLEETEYVVVTVIIDKLEHNQKYGTWKYDPYHYCLLILVERFVLWLRRKDAVGDVLAESRGGKEDRRLKDSFERVYENGSQFLGRQEFHTRLTSRQLKVKGKANNIAGLQIADVIAHPSYRSTLARLNNEELAANFGGQIAAILERLKYDRDHQGEIYGWGRKWLP
ncbi:MAG: DUF3800 domain-containing protein [Planctomycetota bacterium]|nr:DUF3800 domain-containing protein [Planctomycetota bacterium]